MYIAYTKSGSCEPPENLANITNATDAQTHAQDVIGRRALARIPNELEAWARKHGVTRFIVAGGALLAGDVADIDVFPSPLELKEFNQGLRYLTSDETPVVELPSTPVVQLCNEEVHSLKSLVDSFDFAHCQVGVEVRVNEVQDPDDSDFDPKAPTFTVMQTYLSPHFMAAMMTGGTYYVQGKWPLRSLARVPKVAAKLGLSKTEAQALAYQVVKHIAKMGMEEVLRDDPKLCETLGVKPPPAPEPKVAKKAPFYAIVDELDLG